MSKESYQEPKISIIPSKELLSIIDTVFMGNIRRHNGRRLTTDDLTVAHLFIDPGTFREVNPPQGPQLLTLIMPKDMFALNMIKTPQRLWQSRVVLNIFRFPHPDYDDMPRSIEMAMGINMRRKSIIKTNQLATLDNGEFTLHHWTYFDASGVSREGNILLIKDRNVYTPPTSDTVKVKNPVIFVGCEGFAVENGDSYHGFLISE